MSRYFNAAGFPKNANQRAAQALDLSLDAATKKIGLNTDKARDILAAHLDGARRLKAHRVRRYCQYLEMVSR